MATPGSVLVSVDKLINKKVKDMPDRLKRRVKHEIIAICGILERDPLMSKSKLYKARFVAEAPASEFDCYRVDLKGQPLKILYDVERPKSKVKVHLRDIRPVGFPDV